MELKTRKTPIWREVIGMFPCVLDLAPRGIAGAWVYLARTNRLKLFAGVHGQAKMDGVRSQLN